MAQSNMGLHAVVDMGSNGIRCSIADLTHSATNHPRLLRNLYADRIAISLHDAQYPGNTSTRHALSKGTIASVTEALKRFKQTCADFDVPSQNVTVVATEATRTASNADEFLGTVKQELDWDVKLLSKEEEAAAGAMGIATSVPMVNGLAMDLGGGSLQLTRLNTTQEGWYENLHEQSVSLPYGAAALLKRIDAVKHSTKEQAALKKELTMALKQALTDINLSRDHIPDDGIPIFLSGGGFRGWGYLLMALRSPYPIHWINGFQVSPDEFFGVKPVAKFASKANLDSEDEGSIFRVSQRRLRQLPATYLVVDCLRDAIVKVSNVTFCQGGTQAGVLFSKIPPELKGQLTHGQGFEYALRAVHPVEGVDTLTKNIFSSLLVSGARNPSLANSSLDDRLLNLVVSLAQSMYIHAGHEKDMRAFSALRFTNIGELGSTIGITHFERAALSLMLTERYGGRKGLPPQEQNVWDQFQAMVGSQAAWWCCYIGRVAALLAVIWPAGIRESNDPAIKDRLKMQCVPAPSCDMRLEVTVDSIYEEIVGEAVAKVAKLGKKKNWSSPQGSEPFGLKIDAGISLKKPP